MVGKRLSDVQGIQLTAKAMGQLLGVTDRQVRYLADEGKIPKLANGSYELPYAMTTYISGLRAAENQEKADIRKSGDLNDEKLLHERAKRKKAELQLGQMRGELHRGPIVEKVMTDMLSNLRAKLLSIPTKTAPLLIGRSGISELEGILEDAIIESLEELSDYDPSLFVDDTYVDLDEDELEELVDSHE